jgi:hypothetical protein
MRDVHSGWRATDAPRLRSEASSLARNGIDAVTCAGGDIRDESAPTNVQVVQGMLR